MLDRYPDRLPVIVERGSTSLLPLIANNKYLVPNDLTAYHFLYIIRKRLQLPPSDALFLFVNDHVLLKGDQLMMQVYNSMKDTDKFLYITYREETVLGAG